MSVRTLLRVHFIARARATAQLIDYLGRRAMASKRHRDVYAFFREAVANNGCQKQVTSTRAT